METLNKQQTENKIANDNALFINVLPKDNFAEEHIPGSINIPVKSEDFVEKVEQRAGSRDQQIVVYCANAECSASDDAAEKLEQAGFTSVYDFAGGLKEWKDEGGQTEGRRAA